MVQCARLGPRRAPRPTHEGEGTCARRCSGAWGSRPWPCCWRRALPTPRRARSSPSVSPRIEQKRLFIAVVWIAAAVFVIVEGGILFLVIRYRHRKGRERMPKQTHGNTRLEIGWTIAPALVLAVVMVPTISMIWDLARPPSPGALNITVQGYQWWWGFQYSDSDMTVGSGEQRPIEIADVMVVPDRPRDLPFARSRRGWREEHGRNPRLPGDPLVLGPRAVRQAGRRAGSHEPHHVPGRRTGHVHRTVRRVLRAPARPDEAPRGGARSRRLGAVGRQPAAGTGARLGSARQAGRGDLHEPALGWPGRLHRVPCGRRRRRGGGTEPQPLQRTDAPVFRGLQLGNLRCGRAQGLAARSRTP